ncbi:MAG TPA: ABC transporter substrate-binding protein [Chloroflexota bacterium]|jgi:NitT/TauT family transport system substrate-binding protein|nr:ABC transporter substrate-binding protein [Chloroflexota bacterium]
MRLWLGRPLAVGCAVALLLGCAGRGQAPTPSTAPATPSPAGNTPAPAAAQASTPPLQTLRYSLQTHAATHWAVYIAQQKGLFAQQGLELDMTVTQTAARSIQFLVSDALDLASTSAGSMIKANEQGADLVIVSGLNNNVVYSLVAQPDLPSFAALRGKTIGVSDLADGSTVLMRKLLRANGLADNDYEIVQVGGTSERYAALKSGGVAAAMLIQPTDFRAVREGFRQLGMTSEVVTNYAFIVDIVRREWARQHEPLLLAYLRARIAADRWLYDPANREEALAILMDTLKATPEDATATYDLLVRQFQIYSHAAEVNLSGLRTLLEAMSELGQLTPPLPDPATLVDDSYRQRAGG